MEAIWQHFKQLADHERLAHAYLVVGSPALAGRAFSLLAAKYLLCPEPGKPDGCACPVCRRVEQGSHGDYHWIEPQGKSRTILVEQVEAMLRQIYETAFEGGWKVLAVAHADRIQPDAGNKLLKALEEPPSKTLILLLTAEPQSVLGTLVSRCQRLVLHETDVEELPSWHTDLYRLLEQGPALDTFSAMTQAAAYRALFDRVKTELTAKIEEECKDREEITDEMIEARATAAAKEAWAAMFGHLDRWFRDLLILKGGGDAAHVLNHERMETLNRQAESLSYLGALRRLRAIERISRRIDRNLPVQVAFENGLLG